ncbi:MAG: RNA-binding S4 domain-containing protein [Stellaceae bacterium]
MNGATLRLDKFLWHARLARSRSVAARLCLGGKVAIGAAPALKPHHPVRIGDRLTIEHGRWLRRIVIRSLPPRRSGAAAALLCYDEPEPPCLVPAEPWIPLIDEEISEIA